MIGTQVPDGADLAEVSAGAREGALEGLLRDTEGLGAGDWVRVAVFDVPGPR